MAEQVKAFKANDGKLFENEAACDRYDTQQSFQEWYSINYPLGNYVGSQVGWSTMKEWLRDNRLIIMTYLKSLED